MAKVLDATALGQRPTPEPAGGLARYRADMPELEIEGQALTRAGSQLAGEADKLFTAYKHEQAKVDTLRAEDAYTQLRNEQLKLTYGPGGYATRRGQDAVLGPNIEAQEGIFNDAAQRIAATLGNDDQKRLFQQRANIAGTEYKEGFLRHQLRERNVWATDVTNNGVDSELNQIGSQYARPNFDPIAAANATSASLIRMRSLIASHADDLGLSEAGVNKAFTAATDKAITNKLLAWSSWDPVGAFENFKAHQTELSDPAHRLTLRNTLWERALPVQVSVEAQGAIDKARKDLPPINAPTTGEETFQSVVGSLLKREGGYVSKDGKSGAPANFGINQRANPDIDVAKLTKPGAIEIYRKRYWNEIGGENLAPATALVALDTAALQGPAVAKALIASTGGDPAAMIAVRKQQLTALAARDPAQAQYLPAWLARMDSLAAEVTQMPEGGMQRVSATERALNPSTSSLPTARNVAAQLPLALMQVEKRATELYGPNQGDADRSAFVKRLSDEIRSRNTHDTQMVQNQQREALQLVGNIVLGPIVAGGAPAAGGIMPTGGGAGGNQRGMMKLTSFSELMANPQAAAAYQLLDFDGKRAVDTMLKVNANQSEHGDPALFNALRNDIWDGKIKWTQTIEADPRVRAGNLNLTQLNALRGELTRAPSEGGRTQQGLLTWGTKVAHDVFNAPNQALTLMGKSAIAEAAWSQDAMRAVAKYREKGDDISELFEIGGPKSLISEANLDLYKTKAMGGPATPANALAQQAALARAGGPAAVPPVAAPVTLKTADEVAAWIQTLPANVTQFVDHDGVVRTIPGRTPTASPGTQAGPAGAVPAAAAAPAAAIPAPTASAPAAAAAKKDPDALPTFRAQRGMSPEEQEQHLGGLWAAAKAMGGALLPNPLESGIIGSARDLVGAVLRHSKEFRETETRAMFQFLLKKDDFTPLDVPVIRAAIKHGNLDPGDLKKAKAMLKAAGE